MSPRWLVNFFLPGSILFLIVGVCLGLALLYASDRLRRLGRFWLLLLGLFYIVASTRVGANLIMAPLLRHTAYVHDAAGARGATAIVVLNAGPIAYEARGQQYFAIAEDGALRALETARVYRLLGDPLVIVQGGFPEQTDRPPLGTIFSKVLTDLGVPPGRIVIEPNSRDTRQHAENLKPYLEKHGIKRFVMVTSPFHMRRAVATFRVKGYDFVYSAAAVDSDLDLKERTFFLNGQNLDRVALGVHEYLGLAYYWWNDWM